MAESTRIEYLFAKLLARYGSAWRGKWAGVEPAAVMADWQSHLGNLSNDALIYGLENLPMDFPPTVGQFREVCLRAPERRPVALAAPKADPLRLKAEFERMHSLAAERRPTAWIADLEARQARGEPLNLPQRAVLTRAKQNLSMVAEEPPTPLTWVNQIPNHILPPGMRKRDVEAPFWEEEDA